MLRNKFLICVVALALTACWNDPKDTVIPHESTKWEEIKPQIEKLETSEKELFGRFMARHIMKEAFSGEGSLEKDMTIGQAIDKQKDLEKQMEAEKLKAEALKFEIMKKNKEISEKINAAATIALLEKKFVKSDIYSGRYNDMIGLKIAYKNTSQQEIMAIRATLTFYDIFGERLGGYNIENDKNIKPGATLDETYAYDVNQFENSHMKIANTDLEKLKTEFVIRDVVFADKSKLSIETTDE